MELFKTIQSITAVLSEYRDKNMLTGFVPTMGALHKGHLSLVNESMNSTDITVVSIYVNPTQFNDTNDLLKYPRNLQKDLDMLNESGCHIVFAPDDKEMYPSKNTRKFNFGRLESTMEGKFRPGHFNGVAQIVSRLFDIIKPDKAYFGKKDFQQLAIIRQLVKEYNYPVEIVGCPVIREPDGLAMSSRNMLLKPGQREAAALIYRTLCEVKSRISLSDVPSIEAYVEKTINANPLLKLEYFQIVDSLTLDPVACLQPEKTVTACIAVYAGKVRLIDNIELIS